MTLEEKKIVLNILGGEEEICKILMADESEVNYPDEIQSTVNHILNSKAKAKTLDKYRFSNDAKITMEELEENYSFEKINNYELLTDRLCMMADEDECFENHIFMIGVEAILKEFHKNMLLSNKYLLAERRIKHGTNIQTTIHSKGSIKGIAD